MILPVSFHALGDCLFLAVPLALSNDLAFCSSRERTLFLRMAKREAE